MLSILFPDQGPLIAFLGSNMNFVRKPVSTGRLPQQFLRLLTLFLCSSHFLLAADPATPNPSAPTEKLPLRDHWTLQSSAKVEAKGEIVASPAFVPKGWHNATV